METYPISSKCPNCGGIDFTTVRIERGIAFTDDRVCKGCGTRYTPPTPFWAAVLFVALGVLFLVGDLFVIGVFVYGMLFWERKPDLCFGLEAGFLGGACLAAGVTCVVYGFRCIRRLRGADKTPGEPG
jgi:hypothetical protein